MSQKIRAVVIDASAQTRGVVTEALEADPAIEVAASWDKLDSIITLMQRQTDDAKIDVVIIDLTLKNAPDIISQLVSLRPPVSVVLMGDGSEESVRRGMKAMQQGAVDLIMKKSSVQDETFAKDILARVRAVKGQKDLPAELSVEKRQAQAEALVPEKNISLQPKPAAFLPKVLAVASSTGGPKAVTQVFEMLKGKKINMPVFLTQHMPKEFTAHFAAQIQAASGIPCTEGKDGEPVVSGHIYVAPGDYHMGVKQNADGKIVITLNQDAPENFCRPAADPMMRSLIATYGGPTILMVVLTGMGQDGMKGAEQLVKEGGLVLAQDKATSVVWGMPGAVATAGLAHKLYPLRDIADAIIEHTSGKIV